MLIVSGKTGDQKYENDSLTKTIPDLDMKILGANLQKLGEVTKGYSISGDEGSSEAINDDLSIITDSNYNSTYKSELVQQLNTLIAFSNTLDVDGSSTSSAIVLVPKKISSDIAPDGVDYTTTNPLPLKYQDDLEVTFVATTTNPSAVTISIPSLSGLSGSIDLVDESGNALTGGELFNGKVVKIKLRTISSVKKAILVKNEPSQATTSTKGVSLLPQQITIANNSTDSDHDLDFTAGNAQADDGSLVFTFGVQTGAIDANFGTGNGMLDAGTVANNTPYYLYAIYNPTTGDAKPLATATKGSPTMPSGYTKKCYIGACHTDGSANIRNGIWTYGDKIYNFRYNNANIVADVNIASVTTANRTLYTLSCPVNSIAVMTVYLQTVIANNGSKNLYLTNNSETDTASNPSIRWTQGATENTQHSQYYEKQLGTTNQLGIRGSLSDPDVIVYTQGWQEYL